jgi:lipopolysaccharide export system protein LptA
MSDCTVARWRHFLLLLLLAGAGPAFSQGGRVVVLQHADTLIGGVIDGEEVRELVGNVRILQENVHISCDRAIQFIRRGRFDLIGNVVVDDDSVLLHAPRGTYLRDERRAEGFDGIRLEDPATVLTAREGRYDVETRVAVFRQNVVIRDSSSTVHADSVTYFRNTRFSIAVGNVTVRNEQDRATITGGRLEHSGTRQYSRMTAVPVLAQVDSSAAGVDTLLVRAMVMEAFRDSLRCLVATDSVRILRADLAAVSGLAKFFTAGDSVLLRNSPVVWYQETQVTGDSMNIYLQRRALYRVVVRGSAFAASRSDSLFPERFDQLTGENLTMDFASKKLRRIEVVDRAISVYHAYEDTLGNGVNRTSGDRIVMDFAAGKLQDIRFFSGIEGAYYPENMVRRREMEYRLPGFLWRSSRPTREEFRRVGSPAGIQQQAARTRP